MTIISLSILVLASCRSDAPKIMDPLEAAYFEDYEAQKEKWTLINPQGELMFDAVYDNMRDLNGKWVAANYKGRWGLIDINGKVRLDFQFKELSPNENGSFLAKTFSNQFLLIDAEASIRDTLLVEEFYPFVDGYARFKQEGLWGIMNAELDTIVEAKYQSILDIENNHFVGHLHNKRFLLDSVGTELQVADDIYWTQSKDLIVRKGDELSLFRLDRSRQMKMLSDFLVCRSDNLGNYFVETSKGNFWINFGNGKKMLCDLNILDALGDGLWSFLDKGKVGIVNQSGEILRKAELDIIYPFVDDFAACSLDNYWGYMDKQGEMKIPMRYPLAWSFDQGLARVFTDSGVGFIDANGEIIIDGDLKFLEIKNFKNGFARAQKRAF